MLKEITWDNPNKMHIDTGYKTFDKQTNVISTGNCLHNTQKSCFITYWNDTKRNGMDWDPGHLLKADMDFMHFNSVPERIRNIIYDKNRTEKVILYAFRTWRDDKEDIFGYVLTTADYYFIADAIPVKYGMNWAKRQRALDAAKKYICMLDEDGRLDEIGRAHV